ncbi:MAG: tetratricopeptide repeat protein [Gammaproteobacteria bacterium]|nr:tetratricopeptide repeat protein [Gammaproteobacteria bacterium]
MEAERLPRKLAAILYTDVVGYSRLMGEDESGTLARLKAHRKELIDPTIASHRGRMVKLMGDGALVEFASVVDALACAVDVQRSMNERNKNESAEQRIEFRMGINLGDVIVDEDDIYGEGVNVAARLEGLADPGGICISESVHTAAGNKLSLDYEDIGEQLVKNIEVPVRAYRIRMESKEEQKVISSDKPALELPDKPSIAVLPFSNMSGDPEQEYFSDGITEDLITALSRIRSFFVIARNTTFTYKDKSVSVQQVAQELGVRYVLEGSVRKGGTRVRISVQLVDTQTGSHVWAERYDRVLDDFFVLQDELTETIVGVIEPELSIAERERAKRKAPESLDAWDLYQRGLWYLYQFSQTDNMEARGLLEQAIRLDPTLAGAHAGLAHVGYWDVLFGYSDNPAKTLDAAVEAARKATALDPKDPMGHWALGSLHLLKGEPEEAIAQLETAIAFNPSYAHAHYRLGFALWIMGRYEEALAQIDNAIRLSPNDPASWTFFAGRSLTLILLERYEEAVEWARKSIRQPKCEFWSHAILASALAHLGKVDEARTEMDETLRMNKKFSPELVRQMFRFKREQDLERFLAGLHKAGLTE